MSSKKKSLPSQDDGGAHPMGLPRYRHANQNGAEFIFNGMPAGNKELQTMRDKKATYLTSDLAYKRLVMVQEDGAIAAARHALEEDGADSLFVLLGERDHAFGALQGHEWAMESTFKKGIGQEVPIGGVSAASKNASRRPGGAVASKQSFVQKTAAATNDDYDSGSRSTFLNGLNGEAVAARLAHEASVVEAARAGLRARHARGCVQPSWRQVEAEAEKRAAERRERKLKDEPVKGSDEYIRQERRAQRAKREGNGLSVTEERAYMRFLKEGPREDQSGGQGFAGQRNGFGSLAPEPLVGGERFLHAALPRNHADQALRALWHQGKKVHLPA